MVLIILRYSAHDNDFSEHFGNAVGLCNSYIACSTLMLTEQEEPTGNNKYDSLNNNLTHELDSIIERDKLREIIARRK